MYLLEILHFISSLKLWKVAPTVWIKFWVQWQPNSIRSKCKNFFDFMRRKKSKDLDEYYVDVHGLPSHLFPQEIPANSGPNKGPRRLSLTNALRNILIWQYQRLTKLLLSLFCGEGRYLSLVNRNAEFQRISRRDKKAFLSDQCKEKEGNNRMRNTRDLFKKIRDTKGTFHAKMGIIKDRLGMKLI